MSSKSEDWYKEIASYFAKRDISANSVEKECGLGSGTFSKFLRGSSDIGVSKLRKIFQHYNIDANIMFGDDLEGPLANEPGEIYIKAEDSVSRHEYDKLKSEYEGYKKAAQDIIKMHDVPASPNEISTDRIQHRFYMLVNQVREYDHMQNDTEVAQKAGIDLSEFAEYKSGRKNLNLDILNQFFSAFDYLDMHSLNWLITGKGNPIQSDIVDSLAELNSTEEDEKKGDGEIPTEDPDEKISSSKKSE
ncbi:hypothetical protein FNH22_13220 [Fulvivirga sp. M361]|uniref:hypothetical protein n=1 Tax=Fulvivirga sp. M361 TaxID=2594266 RepID=UPI00117ADAC3|nr:hypothetical protein [Fulvivirga sp. M361]TRX58829.1 hypothetical protein FNH22_13220 [Fulvivirga sp. M361]